MRYRVSSEGIVWPDSIWLRNGWLISAAEASARIDSFFSVRACRTCRPIPTPICVSSDAALGPSALVRAGEDTAPEYGAAPRLLARLVGDEGAHQVGDAVVVGVVEITAEAEGPRELHRDEPGSPRRQQPRGVERVIRADGGAGRPQDGRARGGELVGIHRRGEQQPERLGPLVREAAEDEQLVFDPGCRLQTRREVVGSGAQA